MPDSTQPNPPRRDALEELQLALREQQVILDTAGVGIVFVKQRVVVRCNQGFGQIFGHADGAAILGSPTPSLYQNEAAARALAVAAYPAMAEGRAFKSEVLM
ncbi:MAG: PAS domain-containing protein [Rhodoferax sp.]|nr:PAS domain-containing protein [Rhodoferax sp.]